MPTPQPEFFTTGGSLPLDTPSYVTRRADEELFEGLSRGEYCYVLTSRQMGKSSLMVRTASRLRSEQVRVAVLDLTALGQNVTLEQWYRGLLERLGEQLLLDDELEEFWLAHLHLGPVQRWVRALSEVVLPRLGESVRLVLFIDEIDSVRALPFSTDEFFAALRECYNRRVEAPAFQRLTFCLMGVALPSDLIRDARTTPFNIGRRINLTDFTETEAGPLAQGLGRGEDGRPTRTARRLMKRILHWTGGHPYLTQRLCRSVAEARRRHLLEKPARRPQPAWNAESALVDAVCRPLFLSRRNEEQDDNLLFVRNRLLHAEVDLPALLDLYARVRAGERVADDEHSPLADVLRLSGIVKGDGSAPGRLVVRNRIYAEFFDRDWVLENMPGAEIQRQRAAFRSGLLRATAIASVALLVVGGLAAAAITQAARAERLAASLRRSLGQESDARHKLQVALATAQAAQIQANTQAHRASAAASAAGLARGHAEEARKSAIQQQHIAVQQRAIAEAKTVERHQQLVRTLLENGDNMAGSGDVLGALAPYAEALRLDQGQPQRERMHRLRLATILAQSPPLVRLWFHQGQVNTARFSPDGRRVLTGSVDRTARVWDLATGRPVTPPMPHAAAVNDAAFSPDGRRIVTGSGDAVAQRISNDYRGSSSQAGALRVWDAATGRPLTPPIRQAGAVTSVAFNREGTRILSAADDGTVQEWDTATGRPLLAPVRNPPGVAFAKFSPDGRRILTGSRWGPCRLWNADTGAALCPPLGTDGSLDLQFNPDGRSFLEASVGWTASVRDATNGKQRFPPVQHMDFVLAAVFSPDGRRIATGSLDGTARVWDAGTGQAITPPLRHGGAVRVVAFDLSGTQLLTGSEDRTARLWDANFGFPLTPLLRHLGVVVRGEIGRSGHILTASSDGTVRLFDPRQAGSAYPVFQQPNWIPHLAFSRDGRLASCGGNGNVHIRSPKTGRDLIPPLKHEAEVVFAEFSRDGSRLVTACSTGQVRVWNTRTGAPVTGPLLHAAQVEEVHFSPDGRRVISASHDHTARVWDARSGRPAFPPLRHQAIVSSACFSPDGRRILTGSYDRTSVVWDAATGRRVFTIPQHDPVAAARFSPDGERILIATLGGTARLWSAQNGRPLCAPFRHASDILYAAFNQAGTRIVTTSNDGTARIWDTQGRAVTPTLSHGSTVFWAEFTPDGRMLVTASRDRTARVWDARTGEPVTPPLRHTQPLLCAAISPDGRRIITGCGGRGEAFEWELPDNRRPVASLLQQAELLSGQRVDAAGVLTRAEPAAIRRDWQALKAAYPHDFPLQPATPGGTADLVQGNLLVNGGFEETPLLTGTLTAGNNTVPGWTVVRGSVDLPMTPSIWAAEGWRSLDLDGNAPGAIRQTFRTAPGRRYRLRFCLAANPYVAANTVLKVRVSAAGQEAEFHFHATDGSYRFPGWVVHTWEFTARDAHTALEFSSLSPPTNDCGPLLDNISVVPVNARAR